MNRTGWVCKPQNHKVIVQKNLFLNQPGISIKRFERMFFIAHAMESPLTFIMMPKSVKDGYLPSLTNMPGQEEITRNMENESVFR